MIDCRKPGLTLHTLYVCIYETDLLLVCLLLIFENIVTYRPTARQRLDKFPRRQNLGKQPVAGKCVQQYATIKDIHAGYRTNKHAAIKIGDKNESCFLCGPRRDCFLGNCVVAHLYSYRGTVFSVLRGPCRVYIRESNCEARSCRSTEEYKKYNREGTRMSIVGER
jgi:hypothetical protein